MYWKEIPVQVQAEDGSSRVSKPLGDRFQQTVDAVAMIDGSAGTDEYLEAWAWSDTRDVPGTAEEAAAAVAHRYNAGFPADLTKRIHQLHRTGQRNPTAGAIDHWATKN